MKFSFKSIDWKSIAKGAGLAMAGAGIAYVTAVIPELGLSDGQLLILGSILSVLANVVRKATIK